MRGLSEGLESELVDNNDGLIPTNIKDWNEKTNENIIKYKPEESDYFDLKEKLDFGEKI